MLDTIISYVDEFDAWTTVILMDTDLQPIILIPTGIGVLGAIIGLAKRVAKVGSGRRR